MQCLHRPRRRGGSSAGSASGDLPGGEEIGRARLGALPDGVPAPTHHRAGQKPFCAAYSAAADHAGCKANPPVEHKGGSSGSASDARDDESSDDFSDISDDSDIVQLTSEPYTSSLGLPIRMQAKPISITLHHCCTPTRLYHRTNKMRVLSVVGRMCRAVLLCLRHNVRSVVVCGPTTVTMIGMMCYHNM